MSLDRVGASVQKSVTNVLTKLHRSQNNLPPSFLWVVLAIERLQIIAFGLVASGVPAVTGSLGFLVVAPRDLVSPEVHAILFWAALAVTLAMSCSLALFLATSEPPVTEKRVGLLARFKAAAALVFRRIALPWAIATAVFALGCGETTTGHMSSGMAPVCGNSSLRALLTAVMSLLFVFCAISSVLMDLTVFDIGLLSNSPAAASHGRAQAMLVVVKCVAAAILGGDPATVSVAVRCLTAIIFGIIVSYLIMTRVPYARMGINAQFIASGAACVWASLVGLLPAVSDGTGTLMPATFGTILMAAASLAWATYTLDSAAGALHLDGSGGSSPLTVWTAMMWVRERLRAADRERSKESALGFSREARKAALDGTAVLAAKPKTSVIEDLVSATASLAGLTTPASVTAAAAKGKLESRELSKADALEKEALLGVAYIEDLFVDHALAQIIVSRFWHQLFSLSHFKERQALTTAKSLSEAFDVRFLFSVCMDSIKTKDGGAAGSGGAAALAGGLSGAATKDIFDRARFEKAHDAALVAMLSAYEAQSRVMRLVAVGQYDFGDLHNKVALGFGRAMARAHEAVESMLAVNSESSQALILATEFFMELAGDAQRAGDLQQRNIRLIDTQRRQAERKVQHLAFGAPCEEISPTDENNAVFTIATEPSRLGEITEFNPSAAVIFGRSDFLGENISGIIPQPIAAVHDRLLQRFLRTGTARLLDSTRFLVARHADATIFPVRFRLFETPPAESDVRPKLTGIISTVNSDEGMIIVGDDALDFIVTAACRQTCDVIGATGTEVELGAVTGAMILPELFTKHDDDDDGPRRPGHRSGDIGAQSVAQRSTYQRTRGGRSRGAAAQFEGVPAWAADMPLRLQAAFAKPTRAFLVPPGQGGEPGDGGGFDKTAVLPGSDGGGGIGSRGFAAGGTDITEGRARGPPPTPPRGRRPSLGRPRRPSLGDDLLDGLLQDGPRSRRGSTGAGASPHERHQSPRVAHQPMPSDAVPVTVRCYALPKPTPGDPSGVLVCWTSRDQGRSKAAAAGAKRRRNPASASSPNKGRTAAAAAAARAAGGQSLAGDPGSVADDASVFRSKLADAAVAAVSAADNRTRRASTGAAGAVGIDAAAAGIADTRGDDSRSKSSFSSMGARKAARRRVETLARHPSRAFRCMRANTVLVAVLSVSLMAAVLALVGDTTSRVVKHQAAVTSALELIRLTEVTAMTVHATAALTDSRLHPQRSLPPGANATADLERAYGREPYPYVAWPVTSPNSTDWRLREAAALQFAASAELRSSSRAVNPHEYELLTRDDAVCVFPETPDVIHSAGHYPMRLTEIDLAGADGGSDYLFGPNCTGVGMSVSDLLDTTLASLETVRTLPSAKIRPSGHDVRFLVENAEGVLAASLNVTVEPAIFALSDDLAAVLDVQLLAVVAVFAFILALAVGGAVLWSVRLVLEQRLILQILFNVPRAIARAINGAAVERYRGLKAKRAEMGTAKRTGGMVEDDDAERGPLEDEGEEDEGGDGQSGSSGPHPPMHGMSVMEAAAAAAAASPSHGQQGRGAGRARRDMQLLTESDSMATGQREALQLAVAGKGRQVAGSGDGARYRLGMRGSARGSARGGSIDVLRFAAAAAGETLPRPRGSGARAADVTAGRGGHTVSPESADSGLESSAEVPDALPRSARRGSMTSIASADASASGRPGRRASRRDGKQAEADAEGARRTTVTDRGCSSTRLGLSTTLPGLVTAVWLLSAVMIEAGLHRAIGHDIERVTHALEMSIWLGKHAHTAAWAAADPSVQGSAEGRSRSALLHHLEVERGAIERRAAVLLHGGPSELRRHVAAHTHHGWLDSLVATGSLPAAGEGTTAFHVLTEDACDAVLEVASTSYYNSDGRALLNLELCRTIHDGVMAQGLTNALSRLLSRSRALDSALRRLWASRDALRLTVTAPGTPEAAAVNVTAEEASVTETGAVVWALLGDVLQVSDPWLRLGSTDLGALLVRDMVQAAETAYALQRDLTIAAAVLVVVGTIVVLTTTISTAQADIRSARRLLHFIPEVAYKHSGVASALDRAFASLDILITV